MAWTQYMTLMLEKLNALTAGGLPSSPLTGELAWELRTLSRWLLTRR
jgi:hypothetical protein